jgi:hypothetical protein
MRSHMKHSVRRGFVLLGVFCVLSGSPHSEESHLRQRMAIATSSSALNPFYTIIDVGTLATWVDGTGSGQGGLYPKGKAGFIFSEGILLGGLVSDGQSPALRVQGHMYYGTFSAGAILTDAAGNVIGREDPEDHANIRPYRVRPDWRTADLAEDAASFFEKPITNVTKPEVDAIRAQYEVDWNNWPWQKGAPFDDVDTNGFYDPAVDIPGIPGAGQTVWFVCNDLDEAKTLGGFTLSPPIGLEVQETHWAYAAGGPLSSVIFRSVKFIYKGTPTTPQGARIDSTYISLFCDPDDGQSTDDLVGCDTLLQIAYVYNSTSRDAIYFDRFGLPSPAGGHALLHGTAVPGEAGDSALVGLSWRHGFRNLPMTAFTYFTGAGGVSRTDPTYWINTYENTLEIYNMMCGFEPRPPYPNQAALYDDKGRVTKLELTGDPVMGTGDIDGKPVPGNAVRAPAGDRRYFFSSGPFTMMRGDTQEVTMALVAGMGKDYLSSVSVMKYNAGFARFAHTQLFHLPSPPAAPSVTVGEMDKEIILDWGEDQSKVHQTEETPSGGFAFEGYNVFQLPTASSRTSDGKRIATFDVVNLTSVIFDKALDEATGFVVEKPVQFGANSGIQRYLKITQDAIRTANLVNGQTYYFAVTAYSYNPDLGPEAPTRVLESAPVVLAVTPRSPDPGVRYSSAYGDTIKDVTHSSAVPGASLSAGHVIAQVVDPTRLADATYNVVFGMLDVEIVWHLVRVQGNTVDTVARNIRDQSGSTEGSPIVDGIQFRVFDVSNDFKSFLTVANANGKIDPPQPGSFAFNGSEFPIGPPLDPSQDRPDGTKQQSAGLTASSGWGIHTGMNAPDMDYHYEYFKTRVTQSGARWSIIIPFDFEIRFTTTGSQALFASAFTGAPDRLVQVPFELWNIGVNTPDDAADDYQMFTNIFDVDGSYTFNLMTQAGVDSVDNGGGGATHSISGGANDPFTDWFYWVKPANTTAGHAGYDAIVTQVQADIAAGQDPYLGPGTSGDVMRRMVLVGWNFGTVAGGSYKMQMPETGTVFRIVTAKPNQLTDVFTIRPPQNSYSATVATADIQKINVFPNPYYGFNTREATRLTKYVTFNHLPVRATLRIFNTAGVIVRTLRKEDNSQFFQWDLRNDNNLPVASGIYIIHVDMPDLGATKILKFALVQEQEILKVY